MFPWSHAMDQPGPSSANSSAHIAGPSSSHAAEQPARQERGNGGRLGAALDESSSKATSPRPLAPVQPGHTTQPSSSGTKGKQPIDGDESSQNQAVSCPNPEAADPTDRTRPPSSAIDSRGKTMGEVSSRTEPRSGDGDRSHPQPDDQSRKAEPGPHMDLVSYPTQDLITLVASLLQRIAAANDKLRRDRAKDAEVDTSASSSSRTTTTRSSPPRSPSSRLDPADMVIPPFRPKASPSPPHPAADQSDPSGGPADRDEQSVEHGASSVSARDATHLSEDIESTCDDATSSVKSTTNSHASSTPSRQIKWPSTTAADHAVSHPSSLLCFHARNIPSIGIETYLQRILKYCPVTNDVFISLLVYFDRMSRKLASRPREADAGSASGDLTAGNEAKGFAIDSYNVHRLVIAGITISSKFHSDVFYTNSRYAKVCISGSTSCMMIAHVSSSFQVGGLPQTELNQLELQFLLLNDFYLMIPLNEMQQYADRLLQYGGREDTA